jgi:hypothetical protein
MRFRRIAVRNFRKLIGPVVIEGSVMASQSSLAIMKRARARCSMLSALAFSSATI